jgi:hypothetical protein
MARLNIDVEKPLTAAAIEAAQSIRPPANRADFEVLEPD